MELLKTVQLPSYVGDWEAEVVVVAAWIRVMQRSEMEEERGE